MTQTSSHEAGWYPDGSGSTRYWDGSGWTPYIWSGTIVQTDRLELTVPEISARPVLSDRGDDAAIKSSTLFSSAVALAFGAFFSVAGIALLVAAAGALATVSWVESRSGLGDLGIGLPDEVGQAGAGIVLLSLGCIVLALALILGGALSLLRKSATTMRISLGVSAVVMLILVILIHPLLLILLFLCITAALLGISSSKGEPSTNA